MAPGPIPPTPSQPGRRHVTFSPTQLRVYRDCPERYYRQYIANEKIKAEFSQAVQRGSAVHKVLATVFNARQRGEQPDPELRPLAERFLPKHLYQQAGATADWVADVAIVLQLVARALDHVPASAQIIAVERSYSYVLGTDSAVHGATIVGKVDLVIRRPEQLLENIEFKTGWAQSDPFQEVICRIGVCEEYLHSGLPVLSTTLQLSSGDEIALDGDREVLRTVLGEIVETIQQIWSATTWNARENDRCAICNYRTSLCSIHGEWSRPNRLAVRDT
jgi:hypothetical protein